MTTSQILGQSLCHRGWIRGGRKGRLAGEWIKRRPHPENFHTNQCAMERPQNPDVEIHHGPLQACTRNECRAAPGNLPVKKAPHAPQFHARITKFCDMPWNASAGVGIRLIRQARSDFHGHETMRAFVSAIFSGGKIQNRAPLLTDSKGSPANNLELEQYNCPPSAMWHSNSGALQVIWL